MFFVRRFAVTMLALSLGAVVPAASLVYGQNYPNKPLRILTGSIGSLGDFSSRLVGQGISVPLGQSVVVDNRGDIAGEIVSRASPDGYTLLVDGDSFLVG